MSTLDSSSRAAVRFILLLGVVSLFADVTYEGARAIAGPYLGLLGASALAVSGVAGLGELLGYGVRLVSGRAADRTRSYWAFVLLGYTVNLFAVPALALTGRWEAAAGLLLLERAGKGLRAPSRDALISFAAGRVGRGFGYGLHEALDQIGAVGGPLAVAAILALSSSSYRLAFAALLVPALIALSVLAGARRAYPEPRRFEAQEPVAGTAGAVSAPARDRADSKLPRRFWIYMAGVGLIAAGYADFPLIAYHFARESVFAEPAIPAVFALAMGVDALAALWLGPLFDRRGISVLAFVAVASAAAAPLLFLGRAPAALAGAALWGLGMGAWESVMKAATAAMAPAERRGSAFGVFGAVFGITWFLGSVILGALYSVSLPALVICSAGLQLAAVPVFLVARAADGH